MSSSDESTKSRGVRAGAVRLRDSIRPAFAEDVYGGPRRSSSSEPRLPSSNAPANTNVSSTDSDLCVSALAQRRSANLPKLRELCSGTSNELNISSTECPLTSARANLMDELEFVYADADSYETELAEFYTYSEMDEFALNFECFVKYMREQKKETFWNKLTRAEQCSIIQGLAASFDSTEPEQRLQAARIILYILQGSYGDFSELEGKKQKAQSLADCSYHTNSRSKQRRRPSSSHNLGDIVENKSCNDGDDDSKSSIDSCETRSGEDENETSELGLPSKWFGPDHGTGDYESDCLINATLNAYLLYEQGLFQPLCSLLRLEVSLPFERYADHSRQSSVSNSRSTSHMDLTTGIPPEGGVGSASGTFERRRSRRSATLADNERIRVVLNCIYHMVESLRREELIFDDICAMFEHQKPRYQSPEHTFSLSRVSLERGGQSRLKTLRTQFITELEEPLEHSKMPLAIILLDMMPTFVRAKNPHYPIKKVILLCWKVLLTTLGGIEFLREEKTRKRRDALLEPIEDTLEAAINMKPLTQSTGPSMGGGTGGESALKRVVCELGSKIRLMPRARQFNRQVACSSATDGGWEKKESITDGGWKNKESTTAGGWKNKKSFKDKERADNEILESNSKSGADKCDDEFVDVNDAIMPADDNNEEKGGEDDEEYEEQEKFSEHEIKKMAAVLKEPGDADLLDEILKELSVDEEDNEEEGTKNKTISEDAIFYRDREPFHLIPKGAVKDHSEASVLDDTTANKYNRHPLVAVQINESLIRRHKNEGSGDSSNGGGDQTPKACQSPVKIASPWPPPPPPGSHVL
uniref:Far11/STRP N-terminal domain-containing protein n=1 Tax=Meloidogyne javanica TaxID=6303 RepID=A0A915MT38_MELJA